MKTNFLSLALYAIVLVSCAKNNEKIEISEVTPVATSLGTSNSSMTNQLACYSNPIINDEGGDPYCLKYNGTYYMYRPSQTQIIYNTSTDLINWSANAYINFTSNHSIWAPEVHDLGGTLYLIYADPKGEGRDIKMCKMISPTSVGNNVPVVMVGDASEETNIDPSIYQEGSDYYLMWKNVINESGSRIITRKLKTSDPMQFETGSSPSILIPDNSSWPTNKEHPCIVRQDYGSNQSRYFLFFDTGKGDTEDYKINYATSNTLVGPYIHKGVLMEKNAARNIYSVGGHSIVRDGDGLRWIIYRAKNTTIGGWDGRKPCIDRLFINATTNMAASEATSTQSAYCPVP